jgi:hypothetical protein
MENRIFPIKIEHDEIWGSVEAIKEAKKPSEEFNEIDAETLDSWKVRHCDISHIIAQLPIQSH